MGRPINARHFGTPTASGNEIKVRFHDGTSVVDGWIVSQRSSRKFRVTDGTTTATCVLVDSITPAAGQMSISVKDDAGVVKQVTKVAAHKVTIDTGESIGWTFTESNVDTLVEMPEAGSATNIIAVTAIVVGEEYKIVVPGDTDFTLIGAVDSLANTVFTATDVGTGTGTVISTADAAADTF